MTELHIDGPHSPDYTREVAGMLAECVRVLNHATQSSYGLHYPADAYELLGNLKAAAAGLPQLLQQTQGFLEDGATEGKWRHDHGRDPMSAVTSAGSSMAAAQRAADDLYRMCDNAQQALRNLAART